MNNINPVMDDWHDKTILQLFHQQVENSPEAIAICDAKERISYAALNDLANNLAITLIANHVMSNDLIALFLPRGIEQIAVMLAIMKCGAAYLPIDIEHASERFTTILKESNPALVITNEAGEKQLLSQRIPCFILNQPVLYADPEKQTIDFSADRAVSMDSLAYVIYTSGSSGTPKGVKISHRNLVSLFKATQPLFLFSADDVWTAFHSFAFDFSVWEIWGALAFGGRLVIVPSMIARQPEDFLQLLLKEKITILNQTPSAFYSLMRASEKHPDQLARLNVRFLIFGGEALDIDKVCQFATKMQMNHTQYINMYGITETTVHATYYSLKVDNEATQTCVIGHALPHLKINLLDSQLKVITQPGVIGEIYLSGEGVAQGYLNRPDLTAERFIADPYNAPGNRMYRSGDLACYTQQGFLEYLGRIDQQVKIRGYRVELNEIEAALNRYQHIDKSVVLHRKDQNGDHSLVAFFTLKNSNNTLDIAQIRQYLRHALPTYMQPSQLNRVDAIPMTINGKVDQKSLLNNLEKTMSTSENNTLENPLESFVTSVWRKVLGVKDIGPDDHFFDLGGQSLNAITVVNELGITMLELFSEPTPRAIAKIILNNIQNKKDIAPHQWLHRLSNYTADDASLSLIGIPYGGGGPLVYKDLATSIADINVYSVLLPGHDPLSPDKLVSFEESVSQCVKAIKNEINGPIAIYGHCAGNALAIEIARRLESSGAPLVSIHLGAMLLNKNPERVIDQVHSNTVSDVVDFLKSIGGLDGALRHDHLDDLVTVFKNDSLQAATFFLSQNESTKKIKAPMHIIVGDDDPMTQNHQANYLDWHKFSNNITLSVIANGGHYFVKYQTRELTRLIQQFHQRHCINTEQEIA